MEEYRVVSNEEEKQFSDTIDCKYEIVRKEVFGDCPHAGVIATPYNLCEEVLSHLPDLNNKLVLVLFNPEFYLAILRKYSNAKVVMITGSSRAAKLKLKNAHMIEINPFSDFDLLEVFKMKFDVVIGNPPYQSSEQKNGKVQKNHNLWSKFSLKAIDLIKDNGFVALITPTSWMTPSFFDNFKKYNLKVVNTNISKYFNVGSLFSYWLLKKDKYESVTNLNGMNIDVEDMLYLTNDLISNQIHKKVVFGGHTKLNVKEDRKTCRSEWKKKKPEIVSDLKTDKHVYEVFHTNAQTLWSSKKSHGHDLQKVIFTISGYMKPFFNKGGISVSEVSFYIPVNNELEGNNLVSYLSSKLIQFIVTTGKWSGYLNKIVIFNLPGIDINRIWTDQELYKHFDLTQEEIDYVEKTIPKIKKDTAVNP